jgi:photosystem I reaction center subunit XII
MLSDTQIVIAMFTALITGIFAVRLGVQLYNA